MRCDNNLGGRAMARQCACSHYSAAGGGWSYSIGLDVASRRCSMCGAVDTADDAGFWRRRVVLSLGPGEGEEPDPEQPPPNPPDNPDEDD